MADGEYTAEWMQKDIEKKAKGDWDSWFDPAIEELKKSLKPMKGDKAMPAQFGKHKGEVKLKFTGKKWGGGKKGPEMRKEYAKAALSNLNEEVRRAWTDLAALNNNETKDDSHEVVGIHAFDEAKTKAVGAGVFLSVGDKDTFHTMVRKTEGDDDSTKATHEQGKKYTAEQIVKEKLAVLFIRPDEPILETEITLAELEALGEASPDSGEPEDPAFSRQQQQRDLDRAGGF